MKWWQIVFIVFGLVVMGFYFFDQGRELKVALENQKSIVDVAKIQSGGPAKDGIPSIDNPNFVPVEEVDFLDEAGLGLGIEVDGVNRYYSYQILNWHEIVNDKINGKPILITFCPLCGTGIAFEREIKGEEVEFGVSGKLFNSNLIMYDRKYDTYWQQATGQAIVGELAGEQLNIYPAANVSWSDWRKEHPDGQVLSTETGSKRDYSRNPYGNYNENDQLIFPVDHLDDDRLPTKDFVYGILVDGQARAYPVNELADGETDDEIDSLKLKVIYNESSGRIIVREAETAQEIPGAYSFWFSWVSFYPETSIWPN